LLFLSRFESSAKSRSRDLPINMSRLKSNEKVGAGAGFVPRTSLTIPTAPNDIEWNR